MTRQEKSLSPVPASRRDFLKTSLAAAAGTLPLARTPMRPAATSSALA